MFAWSCMYDITSMAGRLARLCLSQVRWYCNAVQEHDRSFASYRAVVKTTRLRG